MPSHHLSSVCSCPRSWRPLRRRFRKAIVADSSSPDFREGLRTICKDSEKYMLGKAFEFLLDVAFGTSEEIEALARGLRTLGSCLAGLAAASYACVAVLWHDYDYSSLHRSLNIALPLFLYSAGCFEPEATSWNSWKITTGQVMLNMADAMNGIPMIDWAPRPVVLCTEKGKDLQALTLIGDCGGYPLKRRRRVWLGVAGPSQPILADDIVLCTHTSLGDLKLVEPMIASWQGPISVAVLSLGGPEEDAEAAKAAAMPELRTWLRHVEGALGARRVVASLVGPVSLARTQYDHLYPANLLRQVAMDAASPADLVLLTDPGFVPSAGFHDFVRNPSSPLSQAVKLVLASAPTALLIASFITLGNSSQRATDVEDAGNLDEYPGLDLDALGKLVDTGDAVSFDGQICPTCRSYAWQWLLLGGSASLRFREVDSGDLHHPAWLVQRSVLPQLPDFLHGLVHPGSGKAKMGWRGLPTGLKASSEFLRTRGVQMLLLPQVFLHRREAAPLPWPHWEEIDDWFPLHYFFDLTLRHILARLPKMTNATRHAGSITWRSIMLPGGQIAEVVPKHSASIWTLQHGLDRSLQLLLMASTILGSEGLKLLLSSVPQWTVHAVAVGVKGYWSWTLRELPSLIRNFFKSDDLVAMVDAYDVVLFPCSRSVAAEYASYGTDIVWAAEKSCFPNRTACKSCEERYGASSPNIGACEAFPNLNGGCYMGKASALADALEWMHVEVSKGTIGRDDQENKMHFYNAHPHRVVLDHRQRIFTCFFGCVPERFRIENCSVISEYTGQEVCFAHANGGTTWEILEPLLRELERRGCRKPRTPRKASAYAGMATPRMIWW